MLAIFTHPLRIFPFLVLIGFKTFSQIEKNALLTGIHVSAIINKNSISTNLSPQVGYFIRKKLLLGVSMPPSNQSKTLKNVFIPSDGYLKNKGIVSPFFRTYLFDDAKWQFYLQGSVDLYQFKSNLPTLQDLNNKVNLGATFNFGLVYFIDTSTTLEFGYARPLLAGTIEELPLNKTPYLKVGLNYMWKKKDRK
jgi:hypothetical protein